MIEVGSEASNSPLAFPSSSKAVTCPETWLPAAHGRCPLESPPRRPCRKMPPVRAQTGQRSAPPCPESAGKPSLWQCPRARQFHPLKSRDSPSRIIPPPQPARSIARAPCAAALLTTLSASPSAFLFLRPLPSKPSQACHSSLRSEFLPD